MAKVVVVGGGWAGCAAAISAAKAGADVVILEKTDLLVGLGNVIGSILLVLVWNKIAPVMVYPYPKVNLLKTFGYTGGLVVTYILLGIAFLLTIWWQRFFFKKNKQ